MEAAAMNIPESRIRFCKFEQKSEDYSPKLDQFPIQKTGQTPTFGVHTPWLLEPF